MLGAFVAFIAIAPAPLRACEPASHSKDVVKVTMVVILAGEQPYRPDPRLKCIAREIRKRCKKLKGFRLVLMTCKSVPINKKVTFKLLEEQVAHVIVRHGADEKDRVSLTVFPPKTGSITYRIVCGKFFPIVTPYYTRSVRTPFGEEGGERLILAVCVRPCREK